MAYVSKHNPEEVRESHACEIGRVNFLIVGHSVCVDYALERLSECINLNIGRWLQTVVTHFFQLNLGQLIGISTVQGVYGIEQLMLRKGRPHEAPEQVSLLFK